MRNLLALFRPVTPNYLRYSSNFSAFFPISFNSYPFYLGSISLPRYNLPILYVFLLRRPGPLFSAHLKSNLNHLPNDYSGARLASPGPPCIGSWKIHTDPKYLTKIEYLIQR